MSKIGFAEMVWKRNSNRKADPSAASRARSARRNAKNPRDSARDDTCHVIGDITGANEVRKAAGRAGAPELLAVVLFVTVLVGCAFSAAAQADKATATAKGGEEFFIISSVDMAKKQLLLKEPTEITEILQVNDKTRYTDKSGKAIQFADLRAGDTVFIRAGNTSAGKVAVSIRKGPMTVGELRQRYLK